MIGDRVRAENIPDLIEPIIGYRSWKVVGGKLHSPMSTGCWEVGVNQAECRGLSLDKQQATHKAPAHECRCGLYAYYSPQKAVGVSVPYAFDVIGAVRCWGTIELHGIGMRAEYGEVIALWSPSARASNSLRGVAEGVAAGSIAERLYSKYAPAAQQTPQARAMIAALGATPHLAYYTGTHYRQYKLNKISERYRIPLVTSEQALEEAASAAGIIITDPNKIGDDNTHLDTE